jgi:uncharacterized membrane protein
MVIFNFTFTIPAEGLCVSDYTWPGDNTLYSAYIPISTGLSDLNQVVLGTPFLRAFYVTLSYGANTGLGIAINGFSDYAGKTTIYLYNNPMSWVAIGCIFGGVILMLLLITIFICVIMKRRQRKEEQEEAAEKEKYEGLETAYATTEAETVPNEVE